MIIFCFNVLFFKEGRSRKDNVKRSRIELKKKKIGNIFFKKVQVLRAKGSGENEMEEYENRE